MPSYRQQIPVRDRWCIVAHVRELQKNGPPAADAAQAPAAAQAPPQLSMAYPSRGTAVQVLLPPVVTLFGEQLTEPFPWSTLAVTV